MNTPEDDKEQFNFSMAVSRDPINPKQPVVTMTFGSDSQLDAFMQTLCDQGIITKLEKIQTN